MCGVFYSTHLSQGRTNKGVNKEGQRRSNVPLQWALHHLPPQSTARRANGRSPALVLSAGWHRCCRRTVGKKKADCSHSSIVSYNNTEVRLLWTPTPAALLCHLVNSRGTFLLLNDYWQRASADYYHSGRQRPHGDRTLVHSDSEERRTQIQTHRTAQPTGKQPK